MHAAPFFAFSYIWVGLIKPSALVAADSNEREGDRDREREKESEREREREREQASQDSQHCHALAAVYYT